MISVSPYRIAISKRTIFLMTNQTSHIKEIVFFLITAINLTYSLLDIRFLASGPVRQALEVTFYKFFCLRHRQCRHLFPFLLLLCPFIPKVNISAFIGVRLHCSCIASCPETWAEKAVFFSLV